MIQVAFALAVDFKELRVVSMVSLLDVLTLGCGGERGSMKTCCWCSWIVAEQTSESERFNVKNIMTETLMHF